MPCGDPFEGMNDLYIKCSLGGDSYQSTDTHLRLQTGQKGSFNWRMKFPVSLPVSEYAEGAARLFVQVKTLAVCFLYMRLCEPTFQFCFVTIGCNIARCHHTRWSLRVGSIHFDQCV